MQTNNPKKNWQQPDLILISTNDMIQGGGPFHSIKEVSKNSNSFFISSGNGVAVVNKVTFYNAS